MPKLAVFLMMETHFFFFKFGHIAQHVGSYFPSQGSNLALVVKAES